MTDFKEVVSIERLFLCWDLFRRGKSQRLDVIQFERHLETNLFQLQRDLIAGEYKHSPYQGFFIHDPKERHIHKALVRDRIVHQAIYLELENIFERRFHFHSYSSRVGKGVLRAVNAAEKVLRQVSKNYSRECWTLKCDVRRFYDSIQHKVLLDILFKNVADPEFKILLREVIQSFTFNGKSQGIPIGNLTSQIFTNILLDRLDSYVKHELGVKHYFRYADDCLMINENRAQLEKFFKSMKIFLENELLLQFHPNKIFIKPYHQGVDFLGIILRPHYRTLRTKTLRRIDKRLDARLLEYEQEKISIELLKSTKNSYYSLLAHINGYQKQQELLNKYMVLG